MRAAETGDFGVRVSWALSNRTVFTSLVLERAAAEAGPWNAVTADIRDDAGVTVAEDKTADTAEQMFVSPRDKQPYEVAWSVPSGVPKPDGTALMVIWEKIGVNGKRYTGDAVGRVEEIDEATFQKRLAEVPKKK